MSEFTYHDVAGMIDHALLRPELTASELQHGLDLVAAYGVASVCIMPCALPLAVQRLQGTGVLPTTVIGFPLGYQTTRIKLAEAAEAIDAGAAEIDAVCNISAVRSEDHKTVEHEIAELARLAHDAGRRIKVIFENAYLADDHKLALCEICTAASVDWVKTSTGFATTGATDGDLRLMRRACPASVQVKASGGVRTLERALAIRALGCSRLGTSSTAAILDEARRVLGLDPVAVARTS